MPEKYDGLTPVVYETERGGYTYTQLYAGAKGDRFWINQGGADYYASDTGLDRDQAALLHRMLAEFIDA